ncbi:MAG TPA: phosphatase domain-containing protein [Gemmatimonadaceae bacterium]|jgi:phosphatidate phosphatase APP1|nr:phosphatase domain-containing protein [Gemmatimonadaceae bacterium]
MSQWRDDLIGLFGELAWQARRTAGAVARAIDPDPVQVVGYRGYGTAERVLVLGRVIQDEGVRAPDSAQSSWRNLIASLRRIESDPLPFARVRARIMAASPGKPLELVADDEGFLRHWMTVAEPLPEPGWYRVSLDLADPPNGREVRGEARVLAPAPTATVGVVSDMDDTVLQSEVTSFLRAAKKVLLENALTRLPFPGVAAFYRALERGATGVEANPIFYVSSSPWNLYDVIDGFLEAQRIPTGPLLLRDWDLGRLSERHARHKGTVIREILDAYPELPFLLIGDSGQEDPEIYTELVRDYPGRIRAVYIRNVTPHAERMARIQALAREVAESGSTLVLADDTLAAAKHAAMHGWISSDALSEIGGEKKDDEGTTGVKADAPGVPEQPATPTVVVDPEISADDVR